MSGEVTVRDRPDKKEAKRAGCWEMGLSTSKPTGDRCGSHEGKKASEGKVS